jgi:ribosomal protein S1
MVPFATLPGSIALVFLMITVSAPGSTREPVRAATAAKSITGEIVKVEGQIYVVKDPTGQEVRLHVDESTARLDQAVLQVGDPIQAYVTPEGHATSIRNLGPADSIEHEDTRKPGMAK